MNIKYKIYQSTLYVYISGELDNYNARIIIDNLDELINNHIYVKKAVFNLSEITFMDSTGLGVILGRYKKLSNLDIPMYIENPAISADKILDLSGVYKIIPKY